MTQPEDCWGGLQRRGGGGGGERRAAPPRSVLRLVHLAPTFLAPASLALPCHRCGTSYEVRLVSAAFAGKRLLERHKLVNAALAELMPDIHALSIKKAKTPEEEEAAAAAAKGQ